MQYGNYLVESSAPSQTNKQTKQTHTRMHRAEVVEFLPTMASGKFIGQKKSIEFPYISSVSIYTMFVHSLLCIAAVAKWIDGRTVDLNIYLWMKSLRGAKFIEIDFSVSPHIWVRFTYRKVSRSVARQSASLNICPHTTPNVFARCVQHKPIILEVMVWTRKLVFYFFLHRHQ